MSAFIYGVTLQWKLDIRSKTLLITCYIVPLLFFFLMGGIFTSINPEMKDTLIQSMTVMGVSMGAIIGLPPTLNETYGSDVKRAYNANGVPLYLGLVSMFLSSFFHLMTMSIIILVTAPFAFKASVPSNYFHYFISLILFITVSLSIACVLGIAIKKQSKLIMISQIIFLPSIMMSGIMFPANLLPKILQTIGHLFPATWGYNLMLTNEFTPGNLWGLILILMAAVGATFLLLKREQGK